MQQNKRQGQEDSQQQPPLVVQIKRQGLTGKDKQAANKEVRAGHNKTKRCEKDESAI